MSRAAASGQALLVTFFWSTSFIIAKWVFAEGVGPLTLTGLRYGLAVLVLTPVVVARRRRNGRPARRVPWRLPLGLGLAGYTVTQGGVYLGLHLMDATVVNLLIGLNGGLQVVLWSALLIGERPTPVQGVGIAAALSGVVLYHVPGVGGGLSVAGVVPVVVAGVGYALWIIGNRRWVGEHGALELTVRSMAWGAGALLLIALVVEGVPRPTAIAGGWIVVLALVNTAFAFTLWTHTQKMLASFESTIINNTMVIQVAVLAFVFLGEPITPLRWVAVGVVAAGTVLVQLGPGLAARRVRALVADGPPIVKDVRP